MKILDPGHEYELNEFDGYHERGARLIFMKREGPGYPFNEGTHPGTNCQEVIRVLIDRVKYLDRQIAAPENTRIIGHLRSALFEFEFRAARLHGREFSQVAQSEIKNVPTCPGCGHIGCEGNHRNG